VVRRGGGHDQDFKDWRARAIFERRHPGKGFPADLIRVTRRKLVMLNRAKVLNDLRSPPNNRSEALEGNRAGQHSIRITISGGSASCGPATTQTTSRSSTTTKE
jgi:toxin HigB-1